MTHKFQKSAIASVMATLFILATASAVSAQEVPAPAPAAAPQSGVDRMKAILNALKNEDHTGLKEDTQRAVHTGVASGEKTATMEMSKENMEFSLKANDQWQEMSKQAYVAALPPRDRALGASILLGDGTLPGHQGKLYFFVSRSMPAAMLRAYALDALYTGATLVTLGIRKGDTIKEYVEEAVNEFNNVEGQILAGMEVNPNLFDMFGIKVVPSVVWTNRVGLEDIGSGCQNLPDGVAVPQLQMAGPDDKILLVDKPTCAPAATSSYYKLTGALKLPYVLDRFEQAGLSREATDVFRKGLSERHGNVHQGQKSVPGNGIAPMDDDVKLDRMPRHVLAQWKEQLATQNVQRGPYGPVFSSEVEDEPDYREELDKKVRHGLGL